MARSWLWEVVGVVDDGGLEELVWLFWLWLGWKGELLVVYCLKRCIARDAPRR